MGLLDNLRDRLSGGFGDDYDDDDYYDDEYDDGDYDDEPTGTGLLGNTPRPEAESVAVYTRSGRPVTSDNNGPSTADRSSARRATASRQTSYTPRRRTRDDYDDGYDDYEPRASTYAPTSAPTFNASGQLPPYVLRAEAYEDVQTVVRRVRTNQPVLLVLNDTPSDTAQRILDFCFGLAFGIDGEVQPVGGKTFLVLPDGIQVSNSELDRLMAEVG